MRCLITGANGFIGAHLALELCRRGDTVRCLLREGSDPSTLSALPVERAAGDVTRPETLVDAMAGIDVVFHLAGIRRAANRSDFISVNTDGTRHVAEAMVKARARRLVFCSSITASGPSTPSRPRLEDDPFCPEEPYGESKALAEPLAFSFQDRLEVTAIRPCRVFGPLDRENLLFFRLAKAGVLLKLGGGPRPMSAVDVDDVVRQLLLQADEPKAVGHAFFCAGDETTTVEELQEMSARALGKKVRAVYVPAAALRAVGSTSDVLTNALGVKLPVNRKLVRQLLAPAWTCSIEKAKRLLGYRPTRSVAESIERSARSYLEAGWL
jgi:nucleoside-diphosphate-sugar epimerase